LLLDDIKDLFRFGLGFHHVILDFMRTPLSDYNNPKNFALENAEEYGTIEANKVQ